MSNYSSRTTALDVFLFIAASTFIPAFCFLCGTQYFWSLITDKEFLIFPPLYAAALLSAVNGFFFLHNTELTGLGDEDI